MTGQNFNSYSKLQDLCLQHVANGFQRDMLVTAFITSSDVTLVESSSVEMSSSSSPTSDEGKIVAGVIEFKRESWW